MEYKDYYKTLGVPRTATQAEIKKAFRKLARQSHPDIKPGDKKAEARFKEVNEANEVLSDAAKRKQYDELGANWEAYSRAGAGGAGEGDPFGPGGPFAGFGGRAGQGGGVRYEFRSSDGAGFSDFFRTFFGDDQAGFGQSPASGRSQAGGAGGASDFTAGQPGGRRRTATADPSIEDLMAGLGGSRFSSTDLQNESPPAAEARAELTLEEAFHGTTRLVDIDGKRLEVTIPPGVDIGSKIRLKGKGRGGGDLLIVVEVKPSHVFERKGADLTREVKVTLKEALLGGEIPVRTLKGRVLLTIPAGTQNGRIFRLTGQGMPRLKGSGNGNLYVRITVLLPTHLSDEARKAAIGFLDLVDQPDPRS